MGLWRASAFWPTLQAVPSASLDRLRLSSRLWRPTRNYVEQWNINLQRQITSSMTATVGYIGSHFVYMMLRDDDSNFVIPTKTSAGYLWPYNPTNQDMRINKNFGGIRGMFYNTDSSYEGLLISVQKRLSHGFQFGGCYSWAVAKESSSP